MAILDFFLSFIKKYRTRKSILKEINQTEKELQDLEKKFEKEQIDEARYQEQKEFREKRLVTLGVELEILDEIKKFEKTSHKNLDNLEETRIRHIRQLYIRGRTYLEKIEQAHNDFLDEKIDLTSHHEKILKIRDQLKKLNENIIDLQEKKDEQIAAALQEGVKHPGLYYEEGEEELEEEKEEEEAEALRGELTPPKKKKRMEEEIAEQEEEYNPTYHVKPEEELRYPKESFEKPKRAPGIGGEKDIFTEEKEMPKPMPPKMPERPLPPPIHKPLPPKPMTKEPTIPVPKKDIFAKLKKMFKHKTEEQ